MNRIRRAVLPVLLGFLLGMASLAPPVAAADRYRLGEAEISVPDGWEPVNMRRDREVDLAGPAGESLMVFWWFPDEPLTGYEDEIQSENRRFPAGDALIIWAQSGSLVRITAAFEHLNDEGERLLMVIEGDGPVDALEATLLHLAAQLRFADSPDPLETPPVVLAPAGGDGGWHHDPSGDFSLHIPPGWARYGATMPGGRSLTVVAPGGDALLHLGVSDGQDTGFIERFAERFYSEVALPREFLDESDATFAGLPGVSFTMSAHVFPLDGITMPYRRGTAWLFVGASTTRQVMLAHIHAEDAPDELIATLEEMAASFRFGAPPPDESGLPASGPPPANTSAMAPGSEPVSAIPSPAEALALNRARLGDDCSLRAPTGDLADALTGLGLVPDAVASCPSSGIEAVVMTLPQDPQAAQAPALGLAYLRAFMAAHAPAVALLDPSRRVLVMLRAGGPGGFSVEVTAFPAPAEAPLVPDASSPPPSPPAASGEAGEGAIDEGALFAGAPSGRWGPHLARGGNAEWMRYENGALIVDVPAGPDYRTTGLRTVEPLVRIPAARDTFSTRLLIDLDTARLDNAVIALVGEGREGLLDWHDHEVWLGHEHWADGTSELVLSVQKQVQGRIPLPDAALLSGLCIEMRPDGLIRVLNATGASLLEGRLAAQPGPGPYHLQISATAPEGDVPAFLALREVRLEELPLDQADDPGVLLTDAPHEAILFDGLGPGPHLAIHGSSAMIPAAIRFDRGLIVEHDAAAKAGLGLYSVEPIIWLDRFESGAQARLRLEFDPEATTGVEVALSAPMSLSDTEASNPAVRLQWRSLGGEHFLTRTVDAEPSRNAAIPAMPAQVDLLLTPEGVQVLADGFPDDLLPWPMLKDGAGLRLSVLAWGDHDSLPARMVLRRISLVRRPGEPQEHPPVPGVELLPVTTFLPDPAAPWEGYGLAGVDFATSGAHTADGTVTVAVEEGYEWARAGALSPVPVAVLDHRLERTGYRLTYRFDPAATDGVEVILSTRRRANMEDGSEVILQLVRQSEGRLAGDWLLHAYAGYYKNWTRRIPAAAMAAWDGRFEVDLNAGTARVSLPGIARMLAADLTGLLPGTELYTAVHSRSSQRYGAARMTLLELRGGWITPPGMTARARMVLMGSDGFDPEAWLDLLRTELEEQVR